MWDQIGAFFTSVGIVSLIAVASFSAFFVVCFSISTAAFFTGSSDLYEIAETKGFLPVLAFALGVLAAVALAIYSLVKLWNRP